MIRTISQHVEELEDAVIDQNKRIGELRKEKDQAYSERNKVVAGLAHLISEFAVFVKTFEVGVAQHDINDKDWDADWRTILVMNINGKQMTWHFHDSETYLLEGLTAIDNYQWDGHTTEEKYERLLSICGIKK